MSELAGLSGWTNVEATGINDTGWVVGDGLVDGKSHAFAVLLALRTVPAVPEPGAWAMVAAGLAMLAGARRRREKIV